MDLLHVRYVTDDASSVHPGDVLVAAITNPWGIGVLVALVAGLAAFLWLTTQPASWAPFRAHLSRALSNDRDLVPWILRLSVGIAVLASGLQAHWLLPHIDIAARGVFAIALLASGFAILVGLAVRVAALVVLGIWLVGVVVRGPELAMAAEVVAASVVLLAGATGRPTLDAYLAAALPHAPAWMRPLGRLRHVLAPHALPLWGARALQIGLGASFLAAGVLEKLADPGPALATAERYGLDIAPLSPEVVVVAAGTLEVLLGLLLMFGVAVRPVAALAFLVLTVTLFALPDDPVAAHVPLWGVASAVFLLGPTPGLFKRAGVAASWPSP